MILYFFTESNGESTVENYKVAVHPDIRIQEVIQKKSICPDRINRNIGDPPVLNRMQEYPLDILRQLAEQYSISIGLLMSFNQVQNSIKEAKKRGRIEDYTYTHEYYGNRSLEKCLNVNYAVGVCNNVLILKNSRVDCIKWIEEQDKQSNLENGYNAIAKKLYFLCWFRNIDTIEIQVPESFSGDSHATQIDLHSLVVVSSYLIGMFQHLHSVIKQVRYVPYISYKTYPLENRFLYIAPDVAHLFPLKEENNNVLLDNSLNNVFIAPNVQTKSFVFGLDPIKPRIESESNLNRNGENEDNGAANKKNSASIFNNFIVRAVFLTMFIYIMTKWTAQIFFVK